jgi:hypothetical protein
MHKFSSPWLLQTWFQMVAAVVLLSLGVGCQQVVKIETPANGDSTAPVTTFSVRFHKDFQPGSFEAQLNGQTITSRFQPTPAPGSVSTASSDFMEATANGNQILDAKGAFTTPSSGIPTRSTNDQVVFSPPTIFVFRGNTTSSDVSLKERETIIATVLVVAPPKEGLTVTLTTDENSAVSLNDAPAGTPITVTIPNNDRRADFKIRGIQTGKSFVVRPLAHGYASKLGGGTVQSP